MCRYKQRNGRHGPWKRDAIALQLTVMEHNMMTEDGPKFANIINSQGGKK